MILKHDNIVSRALYTALCVTAFTTLSCTAEATIEQVESLEPGDTADAAATDSADATDSEDAVELEAAIESGARVKETEPAGQSQDTKPPAAVDPTARGEQAESAARPKETDPAARPQETGPAVRPQETDLEAVPCAAAEQPSGVSGYAHRRKEAHESLFTGRIAAVTRDRRATETAFTVLRDGGTAADAAFAAGMVLSVVEPHFSHALGGGTWALYYDSSEDRVRALDGAGISGSLVELSFFQDPEKNTSYGGHRVIVPGAWDAWMFLLRDEGTMALDELMAPAIRYAGEGMAASRSLVAFIIREQDKIRGMPHTERIFLPQGRVPQIGESIVQTNLAATLRDIAAVYRQSFEVAAGDYGQRRKDGIEAARDYYYRGPIAAELTRFLSDHGGFLTSQDFALYKAEWREPLFIRYGEHTVYECPPNSQGISMLMALNILENFDLSGGPNNPEVLHTIAEATKLAKIDTWHYVADPDAMPVDAERLLSKEYAARRGHRIKSDSVIHWPEEGGLNLSEENDTTTFSIVDSMGNAAAITTSTGAQFLVGGETGILLNQRMAVMAIVEGTPNVIAPRKKVRHTVNPYMAFKEGLFAIAGGNTGFDTQPQGQIQQFLNIVEFGMTAQESVSRPRIITHAFPASHYPHRARNELFIEAGFSEEVRKALAEKGHVMGRSGIIGNGNVIVSDIETGDLTTGADPRGNNLGLTGKEDSP